VRVQDANGITCATEWVLWTDAVRSCPSSTSGAMWSPDGEMWVSDPPAPGQGFAPPTVSLLCRVLDGLRRLPCE
jgi:hypothetical protein